MYEDSIREEFTRQADAFAASPALSGTQALDELLEMIPIESAARWLETACGPAIVGRALAPRVGSVLGVDLTPAMVAKAEAEAAAAGLANIEFALDDATALDLASDSFDGAVNRFTLHHIPLPGRALEEMARVVRPGGWVVVADMLGDADAEAILWREEIERLRDPSHWACLTRERLLAAGEEAGLELDIERTIPLELDFEEWLGRGSGGDGEAALIERLLTAAPAGSETFQVSGAPGERRLLLRNSISRWRVPR